jgi:hypothetical protein
MSRGLRGAALLFSGEVFIEKSLRATIFQLGVNYKNSL